MPNGVPDWNRTAGTNLVHQLTDLGELAVRQGSINSYDRRGATIYMDDFEGSVLQWDTGGSGTGNAVALDTVRARSAVQSVLLTAGSDANEEASITRTFDIPPTGLIGVEYSWQWPVNILALELRLVFTHPTRATTFAVRYFPLLTSWQYLDSAGAYQSFFGSQDIAADATLFHTFKLVVDLDASEYVRHSHAYTIFSLLGIPGQSSAAGNHSDLVVTLLLTGNAGSNDTVRIDDFILTQNEA